MYPELYHATCLSVSLYMRVSRKLAIELIQSTVKKDTMYNMGFYGLTHKPEQRVQEEVFQKRMQA